jgi:hypothetical protein
MRKSVILLLTVTLPVAAQWINYRDPQTPRKNGKPALSAPLPRMNGKTGTMAGATLSEARSSGR